MAENSLWIAIYYGLKFPDGEPWERWNHHMVKRNGVIVILTLNQEHGYSRIGSSQQITENLI